MSIPIWKRFLIVKVKVTMFKKYLLVAEEYIIAIQPPKQSYGRVETKALTVRNNPAPCYHPKLKRYIARLQRDFKIKERTKKEQTMFGRCIR